MTEPLRWYIADRQRGKTQDLITWVKGGGPTTSYPYWTRIILVATMHEANLLRGGDPATNKFGLDYTQVFYLEEWQQARVGRLPVEIGVDNVEFFLSRLLLNGYHGTIVRATSTGDISAWPEVVNRQLEEDK